MNEVKLDGPMFEPATGRIWESVSHKDGAHYNNYGCIDKHGMAGLRDIFPDGQANEMNFCLFSTSGVHGTYATIEEAEAWVVRGQPSDKEYPEDGGVDGVTFLIVHPRICCIRHGNCEPKNADDIAFLKTLRQSSWEACQKIGI